MFNRLTRRGPCKDLHKYSDSGSDYLLSQKNYYKLIKKIEKRIKEIVQGGSVTSNLLNHLLNYVRGKINRIVNKAIGDFYVSTYLDQLEETDDIQTIHDIREEGMKIPKDTEDSKVFPAYFYLTKEDINNFKIFLVTLLKEDSKEQLEPMSPPPPPPSVGVTKDIGQHKQATAEPSPAQNQVFFVSPTDFFSRTGVELKKIKDSILFNRETNSYDLENTIISVSYEGKHAIFCINVPYVSLNVNGALYIIDINNLGLFSENMDENTLLLLSGQTRINHPQISHRELEPILDQVRIEISREAQEEIDFLNRIMDSTDYKLSLGYGYDLGEDDTRYNVLQGNICGLLLCLFYKNTCISSIEIDDSKIREDYMRIFLFTNPNCSNHGYNMLLLSACIIILPKLKKSIKYMECNAVDAKSVKIMKFYFGGGLRGVTAQVLKQFEQNPTENLNEYKERYYAEMENYLKEHRIVTVVVDVTNPVTNRNARDLFRKISESTHFHNPCDEGLATGRKSRKIPSKKKSLVSSKGKKRKLN